jgi:hypothetical protein
LNAPEAELSRPLGKELIVSNAVCTVLSDADKLFVNEVVVVEIDDAGCWFGSVRPASELCTVAV